MRDSCPGLGGETRYFCTIVSYTGIDILFPEYCLFLRCNGRELSRTTNHTTVQSPQMPGSLLHTSCRTPPYLPFPAVPEPPNFIIPNLKKAYLVVGIKPIPALAPIKNRRLCATPSGQRPATFPHVARKRTHPLISAPQLQCVKPHLLPAALGTALLDLGLGVQILRGDRLHGGPFQPQGAGEGGDGRARGDRGGRRLFSYGVAESAGEFCRARGAVKEVTAGRTEG